MKTACLTLVMIGCVVLIHGMNYAFSPSSTAKEISSESSAKLPASDSPTDAASVANGERQTVGTHSDEQRTRRHISDKRPARSYASLTKVNRPKQLRNARERSTPENTINVHQPSSSKPAGATKLVTHRTQPVRTAETAALSGQQLRSAHSRALGTATIGGAVKPARNTAAISGTSINRKHVN
jgi:hypothetical protein